MTTPSTQTTPAPKHYSGWQLAFFILLAVVLTVVITLVAYTMLFPRTFTPVQLNASEQQQLQTKLQRLETITATRQQPNTHTAPAQPEPYHENPAAREITFTEKELNALLANNTDMAQRLAIHLADNLASAKLLVPLDPEFPILGGKTLRLTAGLAIQMINQRPKVILKGVSLWGVPLPNAWLGGMKNVDLVQEFGNEQGFWQAFAEGVQSIDVQQGTLRIVLKE